MLNRRLTMAEIRARLQVIADTLACEEIEHFRELARTIRWLSEETKRRRYVRNAPRSASVMTAALREQLRREAIENPDVPYRDIGRAHGVDGGRVSEAVAGFRDQRRDG